MGNRQVVVFVSVNVEQSPGRVSQGARDFRGTQKPNGPEVAMIKMFLLKIEEREPF